MAKRNEGKIQLKLEGEYARMLRDQAEYAMRTPTDQLRYLLKQEQGRLDAVEQARQAAEGDLEAR